MIPTLSTVQIISENPLYPQNKIDIIVDNDLSSATTIVVPNTTFPYIVEFDNCTEAEGKRYISQRLFKKLTDPIFGDYNTKRGKIFSTLDKNLSIFPYLKLDYNVFINQVKIEREKVIKDKNKFVPELEYYGAAIQSFETISPVFLLKWLDLPLSDDKGNPINKFPLILSYQLKTDLDVTLDLIERKNKKDFYSTQYAVNVAYPTNNTFDINNEKGYENHNNKTSTGGESSKEKKFNNIKDKSKRKTISSILDSVGKISASILGAGSLVSAASALKNKLSQGLPPKPSLPQKPSINFSDRLVKRKVNKAKQKERKRKKLSGSKSKPPVVEPEIKNPSIESLKSNAGNLSSISENAKKAALEKQQTITQKISNPISNVTSYIVTTAINGDTIFVNVANNFGKPSITIQYSAITFTPELAKTAIQFELDNFGIFDKENGFYPKTGSPKPI